MKLSALIAPLIAAKAPHDQIMAVVVAFEAQQNDALEQRRASDRSRQERHRHVTSRYVTVTVPSRASAARVEDKTSTQKIEPQESKKERARAARLAPDWTLPVEWRQDAIDLGLPSTLIGIEAAKLRDWSCSSPAGAKLDWRAAWRNWCRRAVTDTAPRARGSPAARVHPAVASADRLLEEIRAAKNGPNRTDHQDFPRLAFSVSGGG